MPPDEITELGARAHEQWYLDHGGDPDDTHWTSHLNWTRATLTATTPAIQAAALRDFADWLDKTEDLPPKTCADLAREQAALISGGEQ